MAFTWPTTGANATCSGRPWRSSRVPPRRIEVLTDAVLGVLSGFVAGIVSGAFGVGGAILTTPAVHVVLGAERIVAVGTPLPVIFPTTLSGMQAYRRAGQI